MNIDIPPFIVDYFKSNTAKFKNLESSNRLLQKICGIKDYFQDEVEFRAFKTKIKEQNSDIVESNRRAYGDFQTNQSLAAEITKQLVKKKVSPTLVIEPTCGKGTFIIEALKHFKTIKKVIGVEFFLPYVWETKFAILALHLRKEALCKPVIEILHKDIFNFELDKFVQECKKSETKKILIIGNPPWVTNSELGTLNSENLPQKTNFKSHKGIEAITGKGNFDIGEYISLKLLKDFADFNGIFAFLVKSAVVKNIISHQKQAQIRIGGLSKLNIDAKKEFNVSVDACLFLAAFNQKPEFTCKVTDFYTENPITEFGWYKDKFVYSIDKYDKSAAIDGTCPFVWRQGLKHDCSKIMELDRFNGSCNGHYINGFKMELKPEPDLLYGLLKSSDLKHEVITTYRKTTIVTQKKIGQDTNYIQIKYPKTYQYLKDNKAYFDRRKSSIYKNKPPFSIFGIGDYSFAKYKVAISGMYKRTIFSLVMPENEKPLMLDDTCYFIGFDNLVDAKIAQKILNSDMVQEFLKAIVFPDAKRSITKDILMRIDLKKAYNLLEFKKMKLSGDKISASDWKSFQAKMTSKKEDANQMKLF